MARELFERKIKQIQDEILLLGSMVEQATLDSVTSFKDRDIETAKTLIEDDQNINDKRFAIENAILILLATQQPLAHDLRLLAAMLLVANSSPSSKKLQDTAMSLESKLRPMITTSLPSSSYSGGAVS